MPLHKIVARYTDGRLVKGHTTSFSPGAPHFHMTPGDDSTAGQVVVEISRLKAIFFVRDFAGNPGRRDHPGFIDGQPYQGHRIRVEFVDGEVMLGYTPCYDPSMQGFFVFPADPDTNTLKVYAVTRNVHDVQLL